MAQAVGAQPTPWSPPSPRPAEFRTNRILLRPWRPEDAEPMFAAVELSRATALPWLVWAAKNRSLDDTRANITRFEAAAIDPLAPGNLDTGFVIGMFDAQTGDVLGGSGFHRLRPETGECEVGYWVRADRRREGFCTEMLASILTWGFTPQERGGWGFRRIHLMASSENVASCGVPRKLGLRQEVHRRLDRWVDGIGYTDTIGWGVLSDEWDCERSRLLER